MAISNSGRSVYEDDGLDLYVSMYSGGQSVTQTVTQPAIQSVTSPTPQIQTTTAPTPQQTNTASALTGWNVISQDGYVISPEGDEWRKLSDGTWYNYGHSESASEYTSRTQGTYDELGPQQVGGGLQIGVNPWEIPSKFNSIEEFVSAYPTLSEAKLLPPEVQKQILENPQAFVNSTGQYGYNLSVGAEGGYTNSGFANATLSPEEGLKFPDGSQIKVSEWDFAGNVLLPAAMIYVGAAAFGAGAASLTTGAGATAGATAAADALGMEAMGSVGSFGAGAAEGVTAGTGLGFAGSAGGVEYGIGEALGGMAAPEAVAAGAPIATPAGTLAGTGGAVDYGIGEAYGGMASPEAVAGGAPVASPATAATTAIDGANLGYEVGDASNAYGQNAPYPTTTGPSLTEKIVTKIGTEVAKEAIKDALAPDTPQALEAKKVLFSFFGGLPWKPSGSSGGPSLNRISTGQPVFAANSRGMINRAGRG